MKVGTLEIEFMTNLARIQGELTQVKRAVGQTMGEAAASYNQLVRSADNIVASLERQAATHGKTAEQIRAMDVAAKVLALNEAGLSDQATRLVEAEQKLNAVRDQSTGSTNKAAESVSHYSMGQVVLSSAIRKTTDQIAAGAPMATIFAEHIGTLAEVLTLYAQQAQASKAASVEAGQGLLIAGTAAAENGEKVGVFKAALGGAASFLAGPWGIAVMAGVSVLSIFGPKLLEASKAADGQTKAFANLTDATKALDLATGRAHKNKEQEIADAVNATRAKLNEAIATRALLAATLKQEQARDHSAAATGGKLGGDLAGLTGTQMANTAAQIAANDAAIKGAQASLLFASRQQDFVTIQNAVAAATDKVAAAQQRFDAVQRVLKAGVEAGTVSMADANRQLLIAQQRLDGVRSADKNAAAAKRAYNHELAEEAKAAREAAKEEREAAAVLKTIENGLFRAKQEELKDALKTIEPPKLDVKINQPAIDAAVESLRKADEYAAQLNFDKATESIARLHAAAAGMADTWGKVGRSIGQAIDVLAEYGQRQAEIDKEVATNKISQAAGIKQSADLQLNSLIGITDAAKNLFSEHSKGYKAMAAAEKALTLIQLARTAVDVAGGAARMFSTLGPLAFPAVGAMLAVMASLGFAGGGNGGTLPQSNQGKGTTLGSSDTGSASIKNSIEALGDIDRVTMQYSAQMAASLKSIETNIGGLASLLVRTGNISGATAGVQTGFKTSGTGNALAGILEPLSGVPVIGGIASAIGGVIKSLFGTKTSIVGSGIYGGSQDLAGVLSGGFDLQTYADIQKKKKFLGVTTGTSYSTQYGAADSQVADQFTLILKSFYEAIGAAAVPLGKSTSDVEHQLDSFVVDLGKIDFTGLSGDEIQKKLEAVFGAAADQMAATAFPGIEKFQQVGEGAFETLTRVASTVEAVTGEMTMLGLSSKSLGVDASMAIAGMFSSVDSMKSATQSYFETFYSAEEQTAVKTRQLTDVFTSLGLTLPANIAGYRAMVDAQDLTTAAGQQTYATLIQLAPAFAQISTATQSATSAAAIIREREDLEQKLLELQGDTNAIRSAELAKLDASNRAIQQRIYDLQDEQAAQDAATQAAQAAASAQKAIDDERAGLDRQLLELQGNSAAIRALDLAQIDASNQALQQHVWALQDEQAAAQASAQAAAQVAQEKLGLERQLLEVQGNNTAIRALDLASLDASNQALQQHVWALQDEQAAAQASAQAAAQVAQEKLGLERQLLELQGDTTALRALDLASVDASNQALQTRIWAIQDQQAADQAAQQQAQQAADRAAQAADQLRQAWASIADGILAEVQRIRGITETPSQNYSALVGQFNASTAMARAGDQDSAKNLPQISQAMLAAAADTAKSRVDLERIQAMAAASLEQTYALITGTAVPDMPANDDPTAQSWWSSFSSSGGSTSASANDNSADIAGVKAEISELRADMRNALGAIAGYTNKTAKILENVTLQTGGDAISTVAAAA